MIAHKSRSTLSLVFLILVAAPSARAQFSGTLKGDRLILTQFMFTGPVTIDNNGSGGAFRVQYGTGFPSEYLVANSLTLILLDNSDPSLTIDFDAPVIRDVTLDVGGGPRQIDFVGSSNVIGGNLEVLAEGGDQVVELAVNAGLRTADLAIDLGAGFDVVDEDDNDVTVVGDLLFRGVNSFQNGGTMLVVGDAAVKSSGEAESMVFDDDSSMTIMGDFEFVGGPGRDEVSLDGAGGAGTLIGGNLKMNLKGSIGGAQSLDLPNAKVCGDVIVKASGLSTDSFLMHPATSVSGKIVVDLGKGQNDATFAGRCAGDHVSYKGGGGGDVVTLDLDARGAIVKILTGGGVDTLVLGASANLSKLTADFGGGFDFFSDSLGDPYPFKVKFKNYP